MGFFNDDEISNLNINDAILALLNSINNTSTSSTQPQEDTQMIQRYQPQTKLFQSYSKDSQRLCALLKESFITAFANKLKTQRLWWVKDLSCQEQYLLDSKTGILWENIQKPRQGHTDSVSKSGPNKFLGFDSELPQAKQLRAFAKIGNNPLREGGEYKLKNYYNWIAIRQQEVGYIDLDRGYEDRFHTGNAYLIYTCQSFADNLEAFAKWTLAHANSIHIYSLEDIGDDILQKYILTRSFVSIDFNRCRLPKIALPDISNVDKGLWEAYGLPENSFAGIDIVGRNPYGDIQSGNIGIDFGTSSTVVSYEDQNGRPHLLRVGVRDFYEAPQPEHYENPTILEFLDFESFQAAWQDMAQQPLVNWDWVRCSHEALHNLRNNDGDPAVVGSMLARIKQWALRESHDVPVRICDQIYGYQHELAHLTKRNPVLSSALQVGEDYVFDPIELYAWFLGLNINWRGRGIFLKYFMTFPVAYPKDVKEKILASFRRGLLRSLPATLTENIEAMGQFSVVECATEPAAYIASAVKFHKLDPGDDRMAYAVFDFGGGTADFNFGYYRWATAEEEAKGIEEVFEHYESAGDKFLGGENLLENLAYQVFRYNSDTCRQHQIVFTRPLDAESFAGSELLLDKTQAAYTNMLMMTSRLRSFWENGIRNNSGIEKIGLLNRDGEKVQCELSIPYDDLQGYLVNRIQQGVRSFFMAMKKAFASNLPSSIHIFLAGNASRSHLVTGAFGLLPEENTEENAEEISLIREKIQEAVSQIFGSDCPEFIPHLPLRADTLDESTPTAKTGAALGILRLCPGNGVKVVNCAEEASSDEAPFAYYVGNIRRGKFQPGINRNDAYNEWKEIGVVAEGAVFNLYFTQSNMAYGGNMEQGNPELLRKQMQFSGDTEGKKVFVRAVAPEKIELCVVDNVEQIESNTGYCGLQEISFI